MKKILGIISVIIILGVIIGVLLSIQNNGRHVDRDVDRVFPRFFIVFDSIEELNTVRKLFDEGRDYELLSFFDKGEWRGYSLGRGDSDVRSRADIERFLNILDTLVLPADSDWNSLTFDYSDRNLIISYEVLDGADITFIITYEPDYSFDAMLEEFSDTYVIEDITERFIEFVNIPFVDADYFSVGNGITMFEVYQRGTESRLIVECRDGYIYTVGVVLNVDGEAISAVVYDIDSLEIAFEILANIVFARNPW